MKRRPFASRRNAPSPRTASLTRPRGPAPSASAVGWNCTSSRSARAARRAPPGRGRRRWRPGGWSCTGRAGPTPPAASTTARARRTTSRPSRSACAARRRGRRAPSPRGRARPPRARSGGRRAGRRRARHDVRAGGVAAGVHHARGRVGTLAGEAQPAALAVEAPRPGEERRRPGPGPRAQMPAAASTSQRPAPARERVGEVGATVSPASRAAAMPPWARRVLPSPSASLVTTSTGPGLGGGEGEEASRDAAADDDDGILIRYGSAHLRLLDSKRATQLASPDNSEQGLREGLRERVGKRARLEA